jgi:hypothetical protein
MSNTAQKILFVLVLLFGLWAIVSKNNECAASGGEISYTGRHNDKRVCE